MGYLRFHSILIASTILTACGGGKIDEGDNSSEASTVETGATADGNGVSVQDANFLKGICIVKSGDIKSCTKDAALSALGSSVQPVVYLYFNEDSSGAFVAINKLKPGVTATPIGGRMAGPEDDEWPEGSFYPEIIADKSAPTAYQISDDGIITVRAEVDENCSFTSEYVMVDARLYHGYSENFGECGEMREQSTLINNRNVDEKGVTLPNFGSKRFIEENYINSVD